MTIAFTETRTMIKQALTLSLVAIVAIGAAEKPSKEWINRYAALSKVLEKKDVKAFKANFSPDFVSVGPDKKTTSGEDFFREVEGMFTGVDKVSSMIKLKSTKKSGDKVMVMFDFRLNLTAGKKTTHVHEVGTDTWQMINGKWLMVKTVDAAFTVK